MQLESTSIFSNITFHITNASKLQKFPWLLFMRLTGGGHLTCGRGVWDDLIFSSVRLGQCEWSQGNLHSLTLQAYRKCSQIHFFTKFTQLQKIMESSMISANEIGKQSENSSNKGSSIFSSKFSLNLKKPGTFLTSPP
jgi:hypothetical protein